MNPIFIKRFLKYNKSLVGFIGVSLLVVLFLLVIVVLKYLEMVKANNEVNEMRNKIVELQDPRKNKVAVIPGNLDLLKKDYEIYSDKNNKIRPYIGNPYHEALNAAARVMGWKDGDEVAKKFYATLSGSTESLYNSYKRFKINNGSRWDKAIEAFTTEAQKVSFEDIKGKGDDIFLPAIGLPRIVSPVQCQSALKDAEIGFNKFVLGKNISINQEAVEFSLMTPGFATEAQAADAMKNMEIVGDMVSRLVRDVPADRKLPYILSLERLRYDGKSQYREDNKIDVYKYNLKFVGTMDSLRNVCKAFNDAIKDRRVYIVRNLKLSVPLEKDDAAVVVGLAEEKVNRDKDGNVIEIKYRDDSHLAYNLRRDYGKVIVGKNPFFDIEMDIEYMVLRQNEYNPGR